MKNVTTIFSFLYGSFIIIHGKHKQILNRKYFLSFFRYEIHPNTSCAFYLRHFCNSPKCPILLSNGIRTQKGRCKQLCQIWKEKSRFRWLFKQSLRGKQIFKGILSELIDWTFKNEYRLKNIVNVVNLAVIP